MAVKFSNNAATLLAANATTSDTTLTVSDGSVFPTLSGSDHTYVTLEDVNANREIVKVTARSGNNLTVVRAQDGTTARAFSTSDKCELRVTAALLNDLNTDADTESVSKSGDTMTGGLLGTTANFSGSVTAASLDISGDIDVDGTTNLDVVDIDGAVDMASTLTVATKVFTPFIGSASDTDTNIYFPASNQMRVLNGGVETFRTLSTGAVFNEGGIDADFRVESNANTHMLFVDGGNNLLGINQANPTELLSLYAGNVLLDGTSSVGFKIIFDNQGVNQFSADKNYHEINFTTSSQSSETTGGFARIRAGQEVSGNDNKSFISFWNAPNDGTATEKARIASAEFVVNEGSEDYDFRVESDTNTHMLFVDGGNNKVGIGTNTAQASLTVAGGAPAASSPATYAGTIQINETALSTLEAVGGLEFRGAVFGSGYGSKITSTDTGHLLFGRRSNNVSWSESMRLDGSTGAATFNSTVTNKGAIFNYNTAMYTQDSSISSYAANNGLYVNGNSAGYLSLRGDGSGKNNITLYGDTSGVDAIYMYTNAALTLRLDSLGNFVTTPRTGGHAVFNENGVDADFRVESDGNANMLFVDASTNRVGINASAPEATLDVKTDLAITEAAVANATSSLSFYSRFSDGQRGFVILKAESLGSGSSDLVINARHAFTDAERLRIASHGDVTFTGNLVVPNKIIHAGDSDTSIDFSNNLIDFYSGSSLGIRLQPIGATFNEAGASNVDFRVESDGNANMLFVDGGNNRVGVGTNLPTAPLEINAQAGGLGGYTALKIKYGTSSVQSLSMGQVTAGNGAFIGTAQYRSGGNWQTESTAASVIDFGANGNLVFYTNSGLTANTDYTPTSRLSLNTTEAVFNDPSADYDFRVESDTISNAFLLDGATGNIGIATTTSAKFEINHGAQTGALGLSTATAFKLSQATGAPAVGNVVQMALGYGNNYSNIAIAAIRTSAAAYGTDDLVFATKAGTTDSAPTERLRITGAGAATFASTVTIGGNLLAEDIKSKNSGGLTFQTNDGSKRIIIENGGSVVINELGADANFRVESDGNANMLFVDGGNNKVGIGTSSPATHLQVEGASGGEFGLHRTAGTTTGLLGSITVGNKDIDSGMGGIDFTQDGATDSSRIGFFTQPTGGAKIERVRIDSTGKLLVGMSSPVFTNSVIQAKSATGPTIGAQSTASAQYAGGFWNTASGSTNLLSFYSGSSGAQVGRVSSEGGDSLYIEGGTTGGSGLHFHGTSSDITPLRNGGRIDNAIDLGSSANRFKDLFLSGGVRLGGTSDAHKLDDYEEVNFTATLRGSTEPSTLLTVTGFATKIGRVVQYSIGFENENTTGYAGYVTITGLPFTNNGGRAMGNLVGYQGLTYTGTDAFSIIGANSTTLEAFSISSNSAWAQSHHDAGAGSYFWLTGTYMTTA